MSQSTIEDVCIGSGIGTLIDIIICIEGVKAIKKYMDFIEWCDDMRICRGMGELHHLNESCGNDPGYNAIPIKNLQNYIASTLYKYLPLVLE